MTLSVDVRPATVSTGAPSAVASETAAVLTAALLGEYSLLIMPFIVTAMMQGYSIDETYAGNLVSLQLVTMGLAGILVSYTFRYLPARVIVIGSALLIIAANALCALGGSTTALVVGRCLTGLGEGALMAAAGAIAAGVANPHRLFSMLGLVVAGVAAIALIATPFLIQHLGSTGVFWLLSFSPLAALVTVRWLPRVTLTSGDAPRLGALKIAGAPAVLVAFSLLWIGASALWVFAELIGTQQGLTLSEVGTCLAIAQVAGVLGPILAQRFAEGIGQSRSIAAGSVVMAVAGLLMIYGHGSISYTISTALLSIGSMFLVPCFRSLMAGLDITGGVVAMSVAFYTFGFGLAPAMVAVLRPSGTGYGVVAAIATTAFILSGALVLVAQTRGSRSRLR